LLSRFSLTLPTEGASKIFRPLYSDANVYESLLFDWYVDYQAESGLPKMNEARTKLHELKTAGDEAWEDLKAEAETAWTALKAAFHESISKFK